MKTAAASSHVLAQSAHNIRVALIVALLLICMSAYRPTFAETQAGSVPVAQTPSPFLYSFDSDGVVEETATTEESRDPYWWLNSGGKLIMSNGVGETVQGTLQESDPWYSEYSSTNPADTESGAHPQNLFRLVTRSPWDNVRTEASFFIEKDNLSSSENRNESNGLLFMSRYQSSGQTLYYAGVRVDGTAVIKKKYNGEYYTMAQEPLFAGTYDHENNPDLLPHGQWIHLAAETTTNPSGSVTITLFMQDLQGGSWRQIVSAEDSGQYGGTKAILGASPVGLRTDFMDARFDDIMIKNI